MTDVIRHRDIELDGVTLHVAEAGEGPLVLLLHGFPECWYSWRHQLTALAEQGYHVVAPDQRGYARSSRPSTQDQYTILHLVGDVVALIERLGADRAVVVGHDWGALVAWATAQLRPDLVRAVAGLSILPLPRGPVPPLRQTRELHGDRFYWNYFEAPGVAEAEFGRDLETTFRKLLYGASGDRPRVGPPSPPLIPEGGGFLDLAAEPETLPPWLTKADIATFAAEFADAGFSGGLNWYRNLDRNWELTAAWASATISAPALFIVGDHDRGFAGLDRTVAALDRFAPAHHEPVVLAGAGHWIQQERPAEVSAALTKFLNSLDA